MATKLVWLHALTPIHIGTGQGVGDIDLPTARERATNYPLVPGSALKGVLRDAVGAPHGEVLFGNTGQSGRVTLSDLRLVALPVRSFRGTFAWATSPFALRRLQRDAAEIANAGAPPLPTPAAGGAQLAHGSCLRPPNLNHLWLEDLDLPAQVDANPQGNATRWATWIAGRAFADAADQGLFTQRFAVLDDDLFDFLVETALEVRSRVALEDDTKTAKGSGSWMEESLPSETLLAGLALVDDALTPAQRGALPAPARRIQIGGKATIGLGQAIVRMGV